MADLLKTGLAWLSARLDEHASEPITYARAPYSVDLVATLGGDQVLRVDAGNGQTRIVRSQLDFGITASTLILHGERTLPERGDRITVTLDGITDVYEVMPAAPGEDCYRIDPFKQRLRVHAKWVAEG
jgi:hypothetical protein